MMSAKSSSRRYTDGKLQMGWIHPKTAMATVHPTIRDLEWASGFLEGEGSFGRTGGHSKATTERVTASQKDRDVLDRLSSIFGGNVKPHTFYQKAFVGTKYERLIKPIWRWEITGVLARGVMLTLYSLLSNRRRMQIRDAIQNVSYPRPPYVSDT